MLISLTLISPARTFQSPNDPDPVEIERQWCEALKKADVQWFEERLASDFTSISSGDGSLHHKTEELSEMKSGAVIYESVELSDLVLRTEGNSSVVTGVNHVKGHDRQGNAFDVRLAFTDTYVRRNNRWEVWASQHTRVKS